MVLPSISSENLSLGALEALFLEKPVIATTVGGMREAVLDGETGLIVPIGSAAALREAMLRMIRNRDWARELGRRGRADALNRFTRELMIARYVSLFAQGSSIQDSSIQDSSMRR
jgi:glycosyltransferase involved in cell wall biosynthesis